jgi:hypothetical protein
VIVPVSCEAVVGAVGIPAHRFCDRGRGTELQHQRILIGVLEMFPGGTGLIVLEDVVSRFAWLVGLVVCRGSLQARESESCRQTGTDR